jgi:hypothetical protein
MAASDLRVLTQHALTGAWLAQNLPATDLEFGYELNGPGHLTATLNPRLLSQDLTLVDPGTTCIYVEQSGQLTWGGLIWDARMQGRKVALEAASWSSYLQHRYDTDGELGGRGPYTYADPCQVIRDTWAYAQSIADGNLGVVVDATTSTATVGTPADVLHYNSWEAPCLGDKVDDLVSGTARPEYSCSVEWNTARTDVVRRIRLGWPRLGARRTDIAFSTGINIIEDPENVRGGDDYAQVVHALGTGDGSAKKRTTSAVRDGRLRLEHVLDLPDVNGTDLLAARADQERVWRQAMGTGTVAQISLRDTPTAPFGSWTVGDDVYTRVTNDWASFAGWCRITDWSLKPSEKGGQAVVTLKPSASYQFGSAA